MSNALLKSGIFGKCSSQLLVRGLLIEFHSNLGCKLAIYNEQFELWVHGRRWKADVDLFLRKSKVVLAHFNEKITTLIRHRFKNFQKCNTHKIKLHIEILVVFAIENSNCNSRSAKYTNKIWIAPYALNWGDHVGEEIKCWHFHMYVSQNGKRT